MASSSTSNFVSGSGYPGEHTPLRERGAGRGPLLLDASPAPNGMIPGQEAGLGSSEGIAEGLHGERAEGLKLFRAVALVIFRHLQRAARETERRVDMSKEFHEERFRQDKWRLVYPLLNSVHVFPLTSYKIEKVKLKFKPPTIDDISHFIRRFYVKAMLSSECIIICLIYVERLMATTMNVLLCYENWRPVVLTALLLASKVWEDIPSWTVEFAKIAPEYSVRGINSMERSFCKAIGFRFHISGSDYARYYFALRTVPPNERDVAPAIEHSSRGNFRAKYILRAGQTVRQGLEAATPRGSDESQPFEQALQPNGGSVEAPREGQEQRKEAGSKGSSRRGSPACIVPSPASFSGGGKTLEGNSPKVTLTVSTNSASAALPTPSREGGDHSPRRRFASSGQDACAYGQAAPEQTTCATPPPLEISTAIEKTSWGGK